MNEAIKLLLEGHYKQYLFLKIQKVSGRALIRTIRFNFSKLTDFFQNPSCSLCVKYEYMHEYTKTQTDKKHLNGFDEPSVVL